MGRKTSMTYLGGVIALLIALWLMVQSAQGGSWLKAHMNSNVRKKQTQNAEIDWELYRKLENDIHTYELMEKTEYLFIAGVCTSSSKPKYVDLRNTLRQTWFQLGQQTKDIKLVFFDARLGSHPMDTVGLYLEEHTKHQDIIFIEGDDEMNKQYPGTGCTNKLRGFYDYIYRHYDFKFSVVFDDDVFVNVPVLTSMLRALPTKEVVAGRAQGGGGQVHSPIRPKDPRYVSEDFHRILCPKWDFVVGLTMVMSHDLTAWFASNGLLPDWLSTPAWGYHDRVLGCAMSHYPGNVTIHPLPCYGICMWLSGKFGGVFDSGVLHMAGAFKSAENQMSSPKMMESINALVLAWNEAGSDRAAKVSAVTRWRAVASTPQFATALQSCQKLPTNCSSPSDPRPACIKANGLQQAYMNELDKYVLDLR